MAKQYRIFGIKEANADIEATTEAINPLLAQANVTTIHVNGKPLPATSDDVPNALKITAFAATIKPGAADEQVSTMAANNAILAEQAKILETRAVTAETTLQTVQAQLRDTETKLQVSEKNVASLTASVAEVTNLRRAANEEAARLTGQFTALNSEISRQCLALKCLSDLRGKDGAPLPDNASPAERQAAAESIPVSDKIKAMVGAVNTTLAKIGVDTAKVPNGSPNAGSALPEKPNPLAGLSGLELAIAAHKAHKAALASNKHA